MSIDSAGSMISRLKLMQLVSPALPIGAFAYSQGLESAIDRGWVKKRASLVEWLQGIMVNSLGYLDLPILVRMYHALEADSPARFAQWNSLLIAYRESKELYLEDIQIGAALQRLLVTLEVPTSHLAPLKEVSYTGAFATAAHHWQIPLAECLSGFLWAWLENQIAAASKTIPLGQSDAQLALSALVDTIPALVEQAQQIDDDEIGSNLPAIAIASALHETQYSRLFRS